MGDSSLIRTTLLLALLAAMGFVAAGRAPAAESAAAVAAAYGTAAINLPPLR
jgi:p-aminobenzoyl-glutamate transporter AbgT